MIEVNVMSKSMDMEQGRHWQAIDSWDEVFKKCWEKNRWEKKEITEMYAMPPLNLTTCNYCKTTTNIQKLRSFFTKWMVKLFCKSTNKSTITINL